MLYKTGRADGSLINDGENMNLELNLEPRKEPNRFEDFSKPTFEIKTDINGKVSAKLYAAGGRYRQLNDIELIPLEQLFSIISPIDFAKETALRHIRDFNEALEDFNNQIGRALNLIHNDEYKFAVTNKFNWKRGIYDRVKEAINMAEKRHVRPSGMHSIFKRIDDNRWYYNNLKDRLLVLDRKRLMARERCGELTDNIDALIDNQQNNLKEVVDNTKESNKISDKIHVFNFTTTNTDDFYNIQLYTIVIMDPNFMSLVKEDKVIGKMPTPRLYLYFKRPLYKVLSKVPSIIIGHNAASPGGIHPYINNSQFYMRSDYKGFGDANDSIDTIYPWGSLCLSNFEDNVTGSLKRNDYESFVMGLRTWNSIYNIESTHPYRYPSQVFANTGFGDEPVEEKDNALLAWTSFREAECFQTNVRNHQLVENNPYQHKVNESNSKGMAPYIRDIVNSCNEKECPLRLTCTNYMSSIDWLSNPHIWYMMESFVGYTMSDDSTKQSLLRRYQSACNTGIMMSTERFIEWINQTLVEHNYWEPAKPLTMEEKVSMWSMHASQREAIQREERRNLHER